MNVIILSHKRSLNKSEGLITANLNNHITLVCDVVPNKSGDRYKPFIEHIDDLVVSKKFDIIEITQKVLSCDNLTCQENGKTVNIDDFGYIHFRNT